MQRLDAKRTEPRQRYCRRSRDGNAHPSIHCRDHKKEIRTISKRRKQKKRKQRKGRGDCKIKIFRPLSSLFFFSFFFGRKRRRTGGICLAGVGEMCDLTLYRQLSPPMAESREWRSETIGKIVSPWVDTSHGWDGQSALI